MKEAQYYLECGYEDIGYQSPDLSSDEIYPDYIKKEVEETVDELKKYENEVAFAFMTDIHYNGFHNHKIRFSRTLNAYKEISKSVKIDKLVFGGDYTNEGSKEYKINCFKSLKELLGEIDYYPIHGNHDDGTIWDISYIKSEKSKNHFEPKDLYSLFYNHLEDKGAVFDKENPNLYYYCDNEKSKIRYIFLNSNNIPYIYDNNGKLKYSGQWTYTFSQKQLDWLCNEALRFEENGWSVIIFTHSVKFSDVYFGGNKNNDGTIVLKEILKSYKNKCKLSYTYGDEELKQSVITDFSKYENTADIIGVFVGDYHWNGIRYYENIPFVFTGNAVMYCDNVSTPGRYLERYDGDKSELLFDIVSVNKKEKTLHIIRVGAGEDRIVKY